MSRVPVLIVGGGPAGLGAAIALARLGVRSVLVEQRPGITDHPKARAINVRTMELLRQWGLEKELGRYALPREYWRFLWCTTMNGREIARVDNGYDEREDNSPTGHRIASQDAVETVLLRYVRSLPQASVRFSTRCLSLRQDENGVEAELENLESGKKETVAASYLIAADGAMSRIRRRLGIDMEGPACLAQQASIYFRADLTPYAAPRPADIYYCTEGIWIGVVDGKRRWLGIMRRGGDTEYRREDFTPEFCAERIRASVGVADLPLEVTNVSFWDMGAQVAVRFRQGRVFLAGDAAHRMSPTGGFGLNTAIQDSHNLAWKLAAVLAGDASEALLDTYEDERRPVARSNVDWSADNARRIWRIEDSQAAGAADEVRRSVEDQRNHIRSEGRALGFRYVSSSVVPDGTPPPPFSNQVYRPTAYPGCRAPHCWLERQGRRLSTLDLFGDHFVVLTSAPGAGWRAAASALEWPGVAVVTIGPAGDLRDPAGDWAERYGLSPHRGGAVLVRPDGHVAWRCERESSVDLGDVMASVLGAEDRGRSSRVAAASG